MIHSLIVPILESLNRGSRRSFRLCASVMTPGLYQTLSSGRFLTGHPVASARIYRG
ncbi:hypothetical protein CEV34_0364 [Brucella pseudogrignonensis]|uniref:Uncharacterized protein n=1 Tax=Brucella pseudogrignonensis TaxID=419475 RepID=A0A256GSI1_9HYPH|nr:hypothetical protein CEV34_0364 [Brucella pseudogrignonensis]